MAISCRRPRKNVLIFSGLKRLKNCPISSHEHQSNSLKHLCPAAVNPAINAASSAISTTAGRSLGLLSLGLGPQDSSSLSPFTQLLSTLQQLQQ